MIRGRPHFQSLIDEHADAVAAFLRGMVGPIDADDCLQETYLAALRRYEDFDGSNPRGWLLTIARSKAIDEHRSRKRRPAATEAIDAVHGNGHVDDEGRLAEVWEEVAALPDKQRAAVLLRFGSDLRYREVAEAMGVSEAAARRNVHEAVAKLREARGVMC